MDISAKIAYFFIDLLIPLAVGYLCRQYIAGDRFFQNMMLVNIQVIYPVLALLGFWATRLSSESSWLPLIGIMGSVIPGAIAYFWSKHKYSERLDQGSYIIAATLPNSLTLGGITAFILFGEAGFTYTQLITLLGSAFVFLVCFPLAQYFSIRNIDQKVSVKSIIFNRNQLSVVGLAAGAVLLHYDIPRPQWAGVIFDPLVHLAAWTALVPVGRSIDFAEIRRHWRSTLDLMPIKFIATPILIYLLSVYLISDQLALKTIMVTMSTPTGIMAVVTVKLHELNLHITMAAFIFTTVIYLLFILPVQFLLF